MFKIPSRNQRKRMQIMATKNGLLVRRPTMRLRLYLRTPSSITSMLYNAIHHWLQVRQA